MAGKTASKFIYEIQAEYAGESSIKKLQADLSALGKIDAFQTARNSLQEMQGKFAAAAAEVQRLKAAWQQSGSREDKTAYETAARSLAQLTREREKQQKALKKAAVALKEEGVAVRDLAERYKQLQTAARQRGSLAAARNVLGMGNRADVEGEIQAVRRAYDALRNSAGVTSREIAEAHLNMLRRTNELRGSTTNWSAALSAAKGQVLALAGAFAGIGKGVKLSIDFESDMADVRKTVGGTKQEIEGLGRELRQMSTVMPISPNDLASIAAIGGQLGIAREEISKFTDITAKMGAAFDMGAEEAGDAIGKLTNVFQVSLTEVEGLGDAVNQLGNNMAARERDIINVMLRIGGTSRQFGLANESAAALAASFLALGRPAEVAGTAINSMLNRLQTARAQPKRFQEALKALGMSAEEMAARIQNNPQKALDELLDTLSRLEGARRAEILTGLFGQEFQDDVGILVGSLKTYRDAMGLVADRTKYAGAMQDEFRQKTDTTGDKLKVLGNTARDIWQTIGEGFKKMLVEPFADAVTPALKSLADTIRDFPRATAITVGLAGMGLAARPLIFTFSALNVAARTLGAALAGMSGASAVAGFGRLGASLASLRASLSTANIAALGLKGTIGSLAGAFGAWELGKMVGGWLEQFATVQIAAQRFFHSMEEGGLLVKRAWAAAFGSRAEVDAIDAQIIAVEQRYKDAVADIKNQSKQAAEAQKNDQRGVADNAARVNDEQVADHEVTAKELAKIYKSYVEEVKRLQEDIWGRQKSLTAELRDMARGGMNDADAWVDQRNAAKEYIQLAKQAADEARRAQAGGDSITAAQRWKEAVQYADDARAAYKALNHEVKVGDQVVISSQTALKGAMRGVKEAGELAIGYLKEQEKAAADATREMERTTDLSTLTAEMDTAERKWVEGWRKMRGEVEDTARAMQEIWQNAAGFWTNTNDAFSAGWSEGASEFEREWNGAWARFTRAGDSAAKQVQRAIDQATKDRTTTIRIRAIETKQAGGMVGAVRAFARGGKLPGYGGGDRVSALLEAGEFVVRKEAVRKWGAGFFAALNNLRLPELPDLSALLPPMPKAAAAAPMGSMGSMVLELRLPGGDTVAATVSGDDAERLARWNRRVSNTRYRR